MAEEPLVTVGMPTYNRAWSLPRVLEGLLALDYEKKRLRICFVDNDSTDGTTDIIRGFMEEYASDYEQVLLRTVNSNIPEARNVAFEAAEGTDYVFFLDSDIVAPPDAVKRMLGEFEKSPEVGMVALPWDAKNSRRRAGFLYRAFFTPRGAHGAYKVGNGCNIVSMKAFHEVGGFNAKLRVHEDSEFSLRLRQKGFKIVSDPASQGEHLREIKIDSVYYVRFMMDSARTYRELIARGSVLHGLKVMSSIALIVSLVLAVVFGSWLWVGIFAAFAGFAIWLNSSARLLDDGVRIRGFYRPVVGVLYTIATVFITLVMIYDTILPGR